MSVDVGGFAAATTVGTGRECASERAEREWCEANRQSSRGSERAQLRARRGPQVFDERPLYAISRRIRQQSGDVVVQGSPHEEGIGARWLDLSRASGARNWA